MSSSGWSTAFSSAPAGRSVPSSILAEAAAVCNDEWYKKLAAVPGRAAHLRLVFDDDVSLLYWHKMLVPVRAGLELDEELVPTPAQPLGICGIGGYPDTDYLNHSNHDPEDELVRAHVGEHLGVYTVRRVSKTLPFELAAVQPTLLAKINPPRPAPSTHHKLVKRQANPHAPLTILRAPLLLLRTFDRLLAYPSPLDPPRRLALPGLPSHRLAHDPSAAPPISNELALVLRTLRVFFECTNEHSDDGEVFFRRAEWDSLAYEAASLEWIHLWLTELADGKHDSLRRLLTDSRVAHAQAEVEHAWWAAGAREEGPSAERTASAGAPPTVRELEERNKRAWALAWALFEVRWSSLSCVSSSTST
ncbi:hypothetical protein JCM9279_005416 [Rhodotorula babjevae]